MMFHGKQSSLDFARDQRDEGIARAVARADGTTPGWSELAFQWIKLYAQQNKGKRFIGRDVVLASRSYGVIQPPNDRAWGGPLKRAAGEGIIHRIGTAPDPNRHCNPVPLWEA